ncbi:hypothetical protein [Pseudomonas kribbensis]|uniref:hypothetical protein n=1 Tax=Pseudomonas kribbensis TaxID=1628086 RepID=UPI0014320786|nr:hypothetical protein [Pseudomonas kribbensis]
MAYKDLIKKRSIQPFNPTNPTQTPIYQRFQRFSTAPAKLPPNSVGVSVDKVFAIL